jgi:UDP-N-acetylmuramate dehydrogenase
MLNTRPTVFQSFNREITALREEFTHAVRFDAPMAKYTSARVGGNADVLILTSNADELAKVVSRLWKFDLPFVILGGCSNILVSDSGIRDVVVLNRARGMHAVNFDLEKDPPLIQADAAVSFGLLAREAAYKGLSGLEWAAGIPGTLGGAIVNNAGAHGSNVAASLVVADILQRNRNKQSQLPIISTWSNDQFEFGYRSSILKNMRGEAIILKAVLQANRESPDLIMEKIREFTASRRETQPPGASMGSMFKNPTGDYAGRLIEEAGLKGVQVGGAQISPRHANFFINTGDASAQDVFCLIQLAQKTVYEKSGIHLELEIQLIGEWQ